MLRKFAHVPIDEDGWLVSDDKLLKKDEVKVDGTQSAPARGVVIRARLVLARKPFRGHAHRSLGTLVSCARISRVMAWSLNKTGDMFLVWSKVEALWLYA